MRLMTPHLICAALLAAAVHIAIGRAARADGAVAMGTTGDVVKHGIAFGLVAVMLFESTLTALRAYVFSHTTSRIDVELGSRLYRHGAGDLVARDE